MKKLEEQEEGKLSLYRSDISWNNLSKFLFQIFNDVILQKEDVRVSFSDKNMLSDIYEIDTKSVIGHAFVSFHLFHEGLDDHSLIMQESRNERAFFFFF